MVRYFDVKILAIENIHRSSLYFQEKFWILVALLLALEFELPKPGQAKFKFQTQNFEFM